MRTEMVTPEAAIRRCLMYLEDAAKSVDVAKVRAAEEAVAKALYVGRCG